MTAFLFVYGTLLPWAADATGRFERAKLVTQGRLLGRGGAVTGGMLLDLGTYPGLVEGEGLVYGAAYELNADTRATLAWLDAFEGITGGAGDEYIRRERQVRVDDCAVISAWVYVYRLPIQGQPVIASGAWASPC